MDKGLNYLLGVVVMLIAVHCSQINEPRPINFGRDQCEYCKMTISNPKFGAELITVKGRVMKYDATECMVNQINEENLQYQRLYVVPYDKPKELQIINHLRFLISPDFRSPMGANLSAFSDTTMLKDTYYPDLMTWQELLESF